jgi:hypothetical protein
MRIRLERERAGFELVTAQESLTGGDPGYALTGAVFHMLHLTATYETFVSCHRSRHP